MAGGAGGLVAYEIAWIVLMVTGEVIDPETINPYGGKRAKKPPRSKVRIEAENKAGWALLDKFMSGGRALPN